MGSGCTELRDFVESMYAWQENASRLHRQWESAVVAALVEIALERLHDAKVTRAFRDIGKGG